MIIKRLGRLPPDNKLSPYIEINTEVSSGDALYLHRHNLWMQAHICHIPHYLPDFFQPAQNSASSSVLCSEIVFASCIILPIFRQPRRSPSEFAIISDPAHSIAYRACTRIGSPPSGRNVKRHDTSTRRPSSKCRSNRCARMARHKIASVSPKRWPRHTRWPTLNGT